MADFCVHRVSKIQVSVDSAPVDFEDGRRIAYWQTLVLLDDEGRELGKVTAFLTSPEVALPVGDEPPYWGIDQSKALVVIDGEAPF
jgi:hypothetical protein